MQTGDKFTEVGESKVLFHYERLPVLPDMDHPMLRTPLEG